MEKLRLNPRLSHAWESFKIHYRYRHTFCHITVKRAGVEVAQPVRVIVDGKEQPDATIQLVDDRVKLVAYRIIELGGAVLNRTQH